MRLILPIFIVGCQFSASSTVHSVDDTGDVPDCVPDTSTPEDTGEELPDYLRDDDADGYTENEGDCDDTDKDVYPGAFDDCDGVDTDCDGSKDEDSVNDDPSEPNDDEPTDMGSLDESQNLSVAGILHNDDDVDRYAFYLPDSGWTNFTLTMTLANIPEDATYLFSFNRLSSDGEQPAGQVEQIFGSGSLSIVFEDNYNGTEDGGHYELTVEAIANADCAQSYLINVDLDG